MDVAGFWTVFMGVCAGIVGVGGALSVLDRWRNRARKPLDDNTEKVREHDTFLASDKRRIEALEAKQEEVEKLNMMQLKALVTLIGHEVDGNHTKQLIAIQKEINDYLYEKAVK